MAEKNYNDIRYWLMFMDNPNNEALKEVYEHNPGLRAAKEKYDKIIADPEVLELLRQQQIAQEKQVTQNCSGNSECNN